MNQAEIGAPRVGADLAAARERIGASIEDMAAYLRIRAPYLQALEEGRIADLPGNAYAVAFLRSYGRALGLDTDELVRRFRAEAPAVVTHKAELTFPAPVPQRGIPAVAVMVAGLVLTAAAYVGWYKLSPGGRATVEQVAPVPAELAALAPPTASLPRPEQAQAKPEPAKPEAPLPRTTAEQPPPPPPQAPAPNPASALSAAAAGPVPPTPPPATPAALPIPAAPSPPPAARTEQPAASLAAPAVTRSEPAAVQAKPKNPELAIRATAKTWVKVRVRNGPVVLNRVLRAGETRPLPARPDLLLTTANAGTTELIKDGAPAGPLGNPGAVMRDVPLGSASATAPAQAAATR